MRAYSPHSVHFEILRTLLVCAILAPLAHAASCPPPPPRLTTTITGTIYSPNGPTTGDPIPNILVYVPLAAYPPPVFPQGVSGCAAQTALVPSQVLASTTTAYDGSYSLTFPIQAGTTIPLVIQAGKWRRQLTVPNNLTPGASITFNASLPSNASQGDLPSIAMVTGSADALECVFRKIGISDSEFTSPSGTGHIQLYAGAADAGVNKDASGTTLPSETTLMSSSSTLNSYDLAMFACQGTATGNPVNTGTGAATEQSNLVGFANDGGRIFGTHYSYVYLDEPGTFGAEADWEGGTANRVPTTSGNGIATIDTSYPEGLLLSKWLSYVGATSASAPTQLALTSVKQDQTGVVAPTQSWATLNPPYDSTAIGTPIMQFTFDTPVNATTTPSIALSFANNPTNFLEGDTADTVTINVTNTSTTTPADPSLNMTISLPAGLTPTGIAGIGANTGWVCSLATLVCNRSSGSTLAPGATDSVLLTVSVSPTAPLGNASLTAAISGGGLSGTNQCGRVLFNEYHVENPVTSGSNAKQFPNECDTNALTPQEKFLEFSLYNLSNFVAPVTSDTIDIQTTTTVSWVMPAPIYYGTPLSSTQLDATASAPGSFVYNPAAGAILPVGLNTLNVTFTPTDPTSYSGSTDSTTINVLQDTTTTTLTSSVNPSLFGQAVTFTATVTGNAAAPTGTVSFYDGTTLIGTGTLAASTGDVSTATFTTSTLASGSHNITATYTVTTDFGASTSSILVQLVKGTSTTTITGLVSPIYYGQIIGDTGFVNVSGSSTGGTVTVYINGVNVCVLPVAPGLMNSCPPTTGAGYSVGTYTIYAVFSGDPLYNGSTSPTYTVQIIPDVTTTNLTSSLNPSYLGNSVTFTATVGAPYASPTGAVTFYDGGTALGTINLTTQGPLAATASFSTTALTVGSHNITASYAATLNFNASGTTAALVQVVNPPLPLNGMPGYILTVTPTTLNAPVGAGTPISVNINEVNGYSEPVALSCTGLPAEATCGFTLSTVPAGGGTVTLYLTPAAPHPCNVNTPYFVASTRAKGFTWMAAVALCLFFTRRRRRLLRGLALALAICVLPVINGCGSCTDFGNKPGTYSFTVTATATAGTADVQSQTVIFNATL